MLVVRVIWLTFVVFTLPTHPEGPGLAGFFAMAPWMAPGRMEHE